MGKGGKINRHTFVSKVFEADSEETWLSFTLSQIEMGHSFQFSLWSEIITLVIESFNL